MPAKRAISGPLARAEAGTLPTGDGGNDVMIGATAGGYG